MYKYEQLEDENPLFIFTTNSNLEYVVSFKLEPFDNPFFQHLYSVDFTETTGNRSVKDDEVEETIINIIAQFIIANPNAILHYICDSMDGRQKGRNRLFEKWYENHNDGNHSKLNINYPTDDISYTLEFIFVTENYNIDELQENVIQQIDEFNQGK